MGASGLRRQGRSGARVQRPVSPFLPQSQKPQSSQRTRRAGLTVFQKEGRSISLRGLCGFHSVGQAIGSFFAQDLTRSTVRGVGKNLPEAALACWGQLCSRSAVEAQAVRGYVNGLCSLQQLCRGGATRERLRCPVCAWGRTRSGCNCSACGRGTGAERVGLGPKLHAVAQPPPARQLGTRVSWAGT